MTSETSKSSEPVNTDSTLTITKVISAARLLVAAALVTQAKADEALRFAEGLTAAHGPADGEKQ